MQGLQSGTGFRVRACGAPRNDGGKRPSIHREPAHRQPTPAVPDLSAPAAANDLGLVLELEAALDIGADLGRDLLLSHHAAVLAGPGVLDAGPRRAPDDA